MNPFAFLLLVLCIIRPKCSVLPDQAMGTDRFAEYIERTLSFGASGHNGAQDAYDKEMLAWELHRCAAPAGSVLLGDELIRHRISFCDKQLDAVSFARKLLEEAFTALIAKKAKDRWDWYWLGMCHELGRGTTVDQPKAAACFRHARESGNLFAHYEEIWADYLSGTPALETIFRFRYCSGPLQKFAELSARALGLLEMGPVREVGSTQHILRLIEISKLLHEFYFHDGGKRHISIRVGKEMRLDVDSLKAMANPTAALTLYLIAKQSPANPTDRTPEAWLRDAVHPENHSLLSLMKREIFDESRLEMITEVCQANGWQESKICRFGLWALKQRDGDSEEGMSEWFP